MNEIAVAENYRRNVDGEKPVASYGIGKGECKKDQGEDQNGIESCNVEPDLIYKRGS
ncbi:MAG: hypothetical protein WDN75_13400 [Bacteroidota bacterium]